MTASVPSPPALTGTILVTGGAGFIGSHFVEHMLEQHPALGVVVLDKLTYAGRRENLAAVAGDPRCGGRLTFVEGDIADRRLVGDLLSAHGVHAVVNFAAETHVDRSLLEAIDFLNTDVVGTYQLLAAARDAGVERFVQVSTDEVYGSVEHGHSREHDRLDPRSPYSASKAGGDLMVLAFHTSFGLNASITRGSNTYGPRQFPEKLIPLFVTNALEDQPLPLYGDGGNVRDWLYVRDHCRAIELVLRVGGAGEVYNIGAGCERTNVEVTRALLDELGKPHSLIRFVTDRPGHDRRYALDTTRLVALGFAPQVSFEDGIGRTVRWYVENPDWWQAIRGGDEEFRAYYQRQYAERLAAGRSQPEPAR